LYSFLTIFEKELQSQIFQEAVVKANKLGFIVRIIAQLPAKISFGLQGSHIRLPIVGRSVGIIGANVLMQEQFCCFPCLGAPKLVVFALDNTFTSWKQLQQV